MIVKNIDEYLSVIGNDYTKSNVEQSLYQFARYCEEYALVPDDIDLHQWKRYVIHINNRDVSQPEIASRTYDAQKYMEWLHTRKDIENPTYIYNSNPVYDDTIATEALNSQDINSTKTKLEEKYPKDVQYLNIEEYKALIDNTDDFRMEIIYTLLFETGARPSEISELDLDYIYLDERKIRMPTKKNPKKDRRNVYISNTARLKLERWIKGERNSWNPDSEEHGPILTSHQGRMSANRIGGLVREKSKGAKVDGEDVQFGLYEDTKGDTRWRCNCQIFRRSYGVHRVLNGMDISILSKLMGHASIETTEGYLRFTDDSIKSFDDKYRPN